MRSQITGVNKSGRSPDRPAAPLRMVAYRAILETGLWEHCECLSVRQRSGKIRLNRPKDSAVQLAKVCRKQGCGPNFMYGIGTSINIDIHKGDSRSGRVPGIHIHASSADNDTHGDSSKLHSSISSRCHFALSRTDGGRDRPSDDFQLDQLSGL